MIGTALIQEHDRIIMQGKRKNMKNRKKLLSALLAFAMVLSLLPWSALPARAESVELPAESGKQATSWNGLYGVEPGDTVYMGKKNGGSPIAWRVLSLPGDNELPVSDEAHALLISKYHITWWWFSNGESSAWAGSDAQGYCWKFYNKSDVIAWNDAEKAAIAATTVPEAADYSYSDYGPASLNGEHLFLLSAEEADKYFEDNADRKASFGGEATDSAWWLRSPGTGENATVACVDETGAIYGETNLKSGYNFPNDTLIFIRPAFNLTADNVIFAAPASGKYSGTTITPLENNTHEWKLTLRDTSRKGFRATAARTTADGKVAVSYSGAKTGKNEYVSALLYDGEGALLGCAGAPVTAASGTVTFTLPRAADDCCTLRVFNEQRNGGCQSDYAGNVVDLAVQDRPELWVGYTQLTASVSNVAANGGTYSYNARTHTLTLDGVRITEGHAFTAAALGGSKKGYAAIYSTLDALTIVVKGEAEASCKETGNNTDSKAGIYCKGSLTIRGAGVSDTLDATGWPTANGTTYGIYASGSLTTGIKYLYATGVDAMATRGMEVLGAVEIGASTTAFLRAYESSTGDSSGLKAHGTVTVNGILNGKSDGTSGAARSEGVACASLTIGPEGTVVGEGGKTTNPEARSIGIRISDDSVISGGLLEGHGGAEAAGFSCGVYVETGATLTINGDAVFCSWGNTSAISGGVRNQAAGRGWKDAAGKTGRTAIPACPGGQDLSKLKRVELWPTAISIRTVGNGFLTVPVKAPADSTLIAASYESGGKLADVFITESRNGEFQLFLKTGTGYTYKLMLVDSATLIPLCEAASG